MEIQEYARNEYGEIYRVIKKYERGAHGEKCVQLGDFYTGEFSGEEWEYHLKISENILDLIEEGDILQLEISEEWVNKEDSIVFITVGQTFTKEEIIEEIKENLENGIYRIKSIITKEQMKSVEYKIEEEK